jgi:lipase
MSTAIATPPRYRIVDVPVHGGTLRAGVWESPAVTDDVATVIALHGVTAHHLAFANLAAALPTVRVIAPDLRGRGHSNALPGPFGMPRHCADVLALAAHLGVERAVVVGHSMGAFVSVVLAHRAPDLVRSLVLVDGGLPLDLPHGVDVDTAMAAVLGPAAARLSMTFRDAVDYRSFWRRHPAFAQRWTADLDGYFDYDLEPAGGAFRSRARIEALSEDQRELFTGRSLLPALEGLSVPTTLLRAPSGLMDDTPLYAAQTVEQWAERLESLEVVEVADVNHYTILMSPPGARAVAHQVTRALADPDARKAVR